MHLTIILVCVVSVNCITDDDDDKSDYVDNSVNVDSYEDDYDDSANISADSREDLSNLDKNDTGTSTEPLSEKNSETSTVPLSQLNSQSSKDPLIKLYRESSTDPLVIKSESSTDPLVIKSESSTDPLVIKSESSTDPLVISSESSTDPLVISSESSTEVLNEIDNELPNKSNSNSTIETSDCKYQANRKNAEIDENTESLVDYPYSASVKRKGSHYATGALVDKRWVMSSAAEFYNVRESIKLFSVVLGSVDCKRGGTRLPLKSISIFPLYKPDGPAYDISLLRLAWPVELSSVIRPITISRLNGQVVSAKYMTNYWPRIVVNGKVLPETAKERLMHYNMRLSTQHLIPEEKCRSVLKTFKHAFHKSNLCLKPISMFHSDCMPDPGAPLVADSKLWGITSGWTPPLCSLQPSPTIFTRVSTPDILQWIDSVLVSP